MIYETDIEVVAASSALFKQGGWAGPVADAVTELRRIADAIEEVATGMAERFGARDMRANLAYGKAKVFGKAEL